jgi:RimJ/RimL family protein N-acetyltransferase
MRRAGPPGLGRALGLRSDNGQMDTTELALASFSADHFATLASWFPTEGDVVQWGGPDVHFPLDAAQMQSMLDEALTRPVKRRCWMACLASQLVGHAQITFDWRNGNAKIGRVAVAPHWRGQGLGGAMMQLVLSEAFAGQDIERVELGVYTWNAPAVATNKRLGFCCEGVRRSSTRVGDQRWDSMMMSLLRSEFNHGI